MQVTISNHDRKDELVQKQASNGTLSLKDAYNFKTHDSQQVSWGKLIWSIHIPPTKSLLSWRLMHDKVPCDDNLK